MPVLGRKSLRRIVGQRRLRETILGTTLFSPAGGAGSFVTVMDRTLARPDFSGESAYNRAWLRVGSADYQIGSFNYGSGAAFGAMLLTATVASGMDFEIHDKLAPEEINTAIDETILSLRVRREVALPTIDGLTFYTLDAAASPNTIIDIKDVYWFANPSSSLNRDRREFAQHEITLTATGLELRIGPYQGLGGSAQIVLDAELQLSMGAGDGGTINCPWDEETISWGAAARCYDLLIARSPSQEVTQYMVRRSEAAKTFTVKAKKIMPDQDFPLTFSQPFERNPSLSDWPGG
jgi:hypothetical protein